MTDSTRITYVWLCRLCLCSFAGVRPVLIVLVPFRGCLCVALFPVCSRRRGCGHRVVAPRSTYPCGESSEWTWTPSSTYAYPLRMSWLIVMSHFAVQIRVYFAGYVWRRLTADYWFYCILKDFHVDKHCWEHLKYCIPPYYIQNTVFKSTVTTMTMM